MKLMNLVKIGVILTFGSPVFAETPKPPPQPTIITLDSAVHRAVPSGKAAIKVLAEGMNAFVGQLSLAPNAVVPIHRDPTEEFIYVVSGSGEMTINGKKSTVGPGSMVYMPARAEVTFKNGPKPLVALQVFAGPDSAKKYKKWPIVAPGK